MDAHTHSSHAHEHTHVHGGPKLYGLILVALLILTGVTVAVSYFPFESGAINIVVAMAIATVKASLVGLYFMHLKYDKPLNAVIFVSGVFFLGILLLFTMLDDFSRPRVWPTRTTDRIHAPPPEAPEGVFGEAEAGAGAAAPAGEGEAPAPAAGEPKPAAESQ